MDLIARSFVGNHSGSCFGLNLGRNKRVISIKSCWSPSWGMACSELELGACTLRDMNAGLLQLQEEAKLSPQPMMSPFLFLQMISASSSSSRSTQKTAQVGWGRSHMTSLTVKQKRGEKWDVLLITKLKSSHSLSEYAVSCFFYICFYMLYSSHVNILSIAYEPMLNTWVFHTQPCAFCSTVHVRFRAFTEWSRRSKMQEVSAKMGNVLNMHFTDGWFMGTSVY